MVISKEASSHLLEGLEWGDLSQLSCLGARAFMSLLTSPGSGLP